MVVSENASNFSRWRSCADRRSVRLNGIEPKENGFVESCNDRLRDERLNEALFTSLTHAVSCSWLGDTINAVRPNSKLDDRPLPRSPVDGLGAPPGAVAFPSMTAPDSTSDR